MILTGDDTAVSCSTLERAIPSVTLQDSIFSPLHAWRALGQLRAEEAVKPLLSLFEILEDSDWADSEISEVLALISPTILPALTDFIADASSYQDSRICAIESIEKIADRWPEARPACVTILMKQLALFAENDPEINSSLVFDLVELKATEAAPLIEEAFKAERVETFMKEKMAKQSRKKNRKR